MAQVLTHHKDKEAEKKLWGAPNVPKGSFENRYLFKKIL